MAPHALIAGLPAGIGLGYVAAALLQRGREPVESSQGLSICLCGIAAGLAAGLTVRAPLGGAFGWLGPAALSMAVGYALYGLISGRLARATSRSLGLTHFGMVLLTGTAVGLAAGRWWALPQFGPMGTLAVGGLLLIALGGLLEVHGESQPGRSRRLRLAMVFGSLAAAIVLFPAFTRTWTREDRQRAAAGTDGGVARALLLDAVAGVRTACLIGVEPAVVQALPHGRTTRVEVLPLSTWRAQSGRLSREERIHVVSMPASRALRLTRMRYQLVYQSLRSGQDNPSLYCSAEWLEQLHRHLAEEGMLIVELPLSGLDPPAVSKIAGTFQHVSGTGCFWSLTPGEQPRLLLGTQPAALTLRGATACDWQPIDVLMDAQELRRIHSIRSGSALLAGDETPGIRHLLEWLSARGNHVSSVARVAVPQPLSR